MPFIIPSPAFSNKMFGQYFTKLWFLYVIQGKKHVYNFMKNYSFGKHLHLVYYSEYLLVVLNNFWWYIRVCWRWRRWMILTQRVPCWDRHDRKGFSEFSADFSGRSTVFPSNLLKKFEKNLKLQFLWEIKYIVWISKSLNSKGKKSFTKVGAPFHLVD